HLNPDSAVVRRDRRQGFADALRFLMHRCPRSDGEAVGPYRRGSAPRRPRARLPPALGARYDIASSEVPLGSRGRHRCGPCLLWGSSWSPPYCPACSISARISSTRQAVTRGPSFTGLGKRPDFTPAHHVDLRTGISGGIGGVALL